MVLHEGRFPVAPANFLDWRAQTHSFSAMGAAEMWSPNLGMPAGSERVSGLRLTPDTLRMLGVAPAPGRLLRRRRNGRRRPHRRDRPRLVAAALRRRSADRRPLAAPRRRALHDRRRDAATLRVRAVLGGDAELWAPLPLDARRDSRDGESLRVFARLKPGVSAAAAQADVDVVTRRLDAAYPDTNRNVQVVPLKERVVGHTRLGLTVLLVAVGFVLLIACANVAHMLLARAAARQSEIAVRLALGATRFQIVRQLLVESLLLSGLSSVVGLALAAFGVRAVAAMAPPDLPRAADMAVEGWTLAFTLAVSIVTGLVFGLVPAWQAARTRIGDRLGARGTTGHGREALLRDVFVVSELALALVLLVGAGLVLRSLAAAAASIRASTRAACCRCRCRCRAPPRPTRAGAPRSSPPRSSGCAPCPASRRPAPSTTRRWSATSGRSASTSTAGRGRRKTIGLAASTVSSCPTTSRRCGCRSCAAATSAPPTIGRPPASPSSAKAWPAATSRTARRSAGA